MREACPSSFAAMRFANEAVRHQRSGPLVLRRAADHLGSHTGGSCSAHCRLRRSAVWGGARFRAGASRLWSKAAWSRRWLGSAAVRKRTALRCSLAESGTSLRLVPGLLRVARASCRSALVARFVQLEALCLAKVWRGKLALMAHQQSVLHQPPNPSIERTANGGLHRRAPCLSVAPSAAAHVQR